MSCKISLNVNRIMFSNKDYAGMTLEELVSEEKKMKSYKTLTAVFIGLLIGVAIWSATHQGSFILTIILLIVPLLIGSRYSKNLKSIQAEISLKNTVH